MCVFPGSIPRFILKIFKMTEQYRRWCFTDFDVCHDIEFYKGFKCKYVIFGKEVCPTTGKMHHQGYMEFGITKRLVALKKLDDKIHWSACRGSQEENINYCSKEGVVTEWGEKGQQGKRSDMLRAIEMIEEGKGDQEIIREVGTWQSARTMALLRCQMIPERKTPPLVIWIYGPTGVGKTREARKWLGDKADCVSYENGFIIGYTGRNVLFDEFRGTVPYHKMLQLLDRYPLTVNIKGGSCEWSPDKIVITSADGPRATWTTTEDIGQLLRRITAVIRVDVDGYAHLEHGKVGTEVGTEVTGNTSLSLLMQGGTYQHSTDGWV